MSKILIADDNKQNISMLPDYAKKEGYVVITACDGAEAVELLENEAPDVVLLDVMMPRKDGFEVCREIRRKSNMPVIKSRGRNERVYSNDTAKLFMMHARILYRKIFYYVIPYYGQYKEIKDSVYTKKTQFLTTRYEQLGS